jgi:transcriptional regulator with XRE-family HTH domain
VRRLREIRKEQGRTIQSLAREIGRSRQTIHGIENGEFQGSVETWLLISDALGVTLDELLREPENVEGKVLTPASR